MPDNEIFFELNVALTMKLLQICGMSHNCIRFVPMSSHSRA